MKRIFISTVLCSNFRFLSAGILMTFVLAGCTRAQTIDLSTNEAVRIELSKNSEFESKLDRLCIKRLKESARIVVIGNHANDRDCRIDGAFVNSRYFRETDSAFSKNALAALGWKSANQERREQLAKLWVEKGLLVFFTVLYTKDEKFNTGGFYKPQVVSTENGEIIVNLWVSFMTRKKEFEEHKFRFAKDGNLLN